MRKVLFAMSGALLLGGCAQMDAGPAATATLEPRSGSKVSGNLKFVEVGERVRITGVVRNHAPGPKGFHIHETGDCSDDKGMNAGGHFNPHKRKHGPPGSREHHAGDLGNLHFDASGNATVDITVGGISVSQDRPDGIIGRAVIVHAQADDLITDPTGNAGGRYACGVIRG